MGTNSSNKSSGSDDSDWANNKNGGQQSKKKKRTKKMSKSSSESGSSSSDDSDDGNSSPMKSPSPSPQVQQPQVQSSKHVSPKKDEDSEVEEGQVSSSDSDSSSDSEFNDGFDENLMGDEEDRSRLEGLSEKERETEIFKRIERRDMMKTRWEIERKLRIAKKAERAKDRTSKPKKKKKDKEKNKRKEVEMVIPPKPVFKEPVVPMVADVSPIVSPEKGKEDGGGSCFFFCDWLKLLFTFV